jgi:hypothetical protein
MRLVSFLQEGFPWQVEACEGWANFGFMEKIIKVTETTHPYSSRFIRVF